MVTSTTTTTGSFSQDPMKYEGSDWGLYEFVSGNALNGVDPSGLDDTAVLERACSSLANSRTTTTTVRLPPSRIPCALQFGPHVAAFCAGVGVGWMIDSIPIDDDGNGLSKKCVEDDCAVHLKKINSQKPKIASMPDPRRPENKKNGRCTFMPWASKAPEAGKNCWLCCYMCAPPPMPSRECRYQRGGCHQNSDWVEGYLLPDGEGPLAKGAM